MVVWTPPDLGAQNLSIVVSAKAGIHPTSLPRKGHHSCRLQKARKERRSCLLLFIYS
jgi:hypothetical protein